VGTITGVQEGFWVSVQPGTHYPCSQATFMGRVHRCLSTLPVFTGSEHGSWTPV